MVSKGKPSWMNHAKAAFRSGLEATVAMSLTTAGIAYQYETVKVPFTQPEKARTYKPDFILPNGVVVETKGLWAVDDRQKHAWVQAQHPNLDIRMVFTNPNAKISKGSPTTYADVCKRMGIQYAKKEIPQAWIDEAPNVASLAALKKIGYKAA